MDGISFETLFKMDIQEYSKFLSDSVNKEDEYFSRINEVIAKGFAVNEKKAMVLFEANLKNFKNIDNFSLYTDTLVYITKMYIDNRDAKNISDYFYKTINFVCDNQMYMKGKELIDYYNLSLENSLDNLSEDEYIQLIKYQVNFYTNFKKFDIAITLMCECAFLFSTNGAFQSAYRILVDAQDIAITNNELKLQVQILVTQASICLQESDLDNAKIDFYKAYDLSKILNLDISFELSANLATVLMNLNELDESLKIMDEILADPSINENQILLIEINKSSCLRKLGRGEEAVELIDKVLFNMSYSSFRPEEIIEAYLVGAKSNLQVLNYERALIQVNMAMEIIDSSLGGKMRLHYRRGYKESYITRIISIFLELVSKMENIEYKDITCFLAFTKSNIFSDWLSVLDWHDKVLEDDLVEKKDKQQLINAIDDLVSFGAPILNGFYEKYDDPFETIDNPDINPNGTLDFNSKWNKFNRIVDKITSKHNIHKDLYQHSNLNKLQNVIDKKIEKNTIMLSLYLHDGYLKILIVSKFNCKVIDLKQEIYVDFLFILKKYQDKLVSFSQFNVALETVTDDLCNALKPVIISLISEKAKEIQIFQDKFLYWVPLLSSLLKDSDLCEYIENEELTIKNTPIAYDSKRQEGNYKNFLGIIDPTDKLPLFEEELLLSRINSKGENNVINLEDHKIDYNTKIVKESDIIHVATHGFPISKYTDPSYASISHTQSKKSISFNEIQENFWKLKYSLFINSSCDSSDFTSKNYQRVFKTNELIGYTTMFLLNRKSNIISINWPIKDIVTYTFSNLFYSNLARGYSSEKAYILSLVALKKLDKKNFENILSNIVNEDIRDEKLKLLSQIPAECPFNACYCFGAFAMSGLI